MSITPSSNRGSMPSGDSAVDSSGYPYYSGPLGVCLEQSSTVFTVWAPTASSVAVRLFGAGLGGGAEAVIDLQPGKSGSWSVSIPRRLDGTYYDYELDFPDGSHTSTPDPWGKASGANGVRSMVVDLVATDPEGWSADRSPSIPKHSAVVWETHIGDFSNDPHSGIPAEHRGKYAAFCDEGTSVDDAGLFPTGVDYLKWLGVTHVQIMPFYDYGSVDETRPGGYNWGYDPVAYDVPEGSYSSDPDDGACRIRECKAMIAALHRAGLRVIMDVVYNHMYTAANSFELMVPGYFCRRNASGALTDGSGCSNDMASERPMFGRFIVESVEYWAREYHVDGFRFDLMGLIDVETMNRARRALDALPDGESILMYGEPWVANAQETKDIAVPLAWGRGLHGLDGGIGWFCDGTRDALKGSVMDEKACGFVNGEAAQNAPAIRSAVNAWRGTDREPKAAGQLVQYVSAHDDLTLWDKLCLTMRSRPVETDFDAWQKDGVKTTESGRPSDESIAIDGAGGAGDMLAANAIAAGLVFASAGIPFMLSGEEFARTKFGCSNSFDRSAALNQLDWLRAQRMAPLVGWYRKLIALRKGFPQLFDGRREVLASPDDVVAFMVPANGKSGRKGNGTGDGEFLQDSERLRGALVIGANPGGDDASFKLLIDGVPSCGRLVEDGTVAQSSVASAAAAAVVPVARKGLAARLLADSAAALTGLEADSAVLLEDRTLAAGLTLEIPARSLRVWEIV